MFSSKGLFSQTICPHLDECHVPQCIFSHHVSDVTTPFIANPDEIALEDGDQDGHRKKRKISDDAEPSKPSQNQSPKDGPLKRKPSAPTRPISPPPLHRVIPRGTPKPTSSKVETSKVETQSTPKKVVRPAPEIVIKKEALNPRQLKGRAPAGHEMRFRLARALHEHFIRLNSEVKKDASAAEQELVLSEQALISKALDVEEEVAEGNEHIYSNTMKNKIMAYKRMSVKQWVDERQKEVAKAKAVKAAIAPDISQSTEPPKPIETGLDPDNEIKLLSRLYTDTLHLAQHKYINKAPTDEEIEKAKKGVEAACGWEVCDRCSNRFQVFPGRREEDGALASGGRCTYHYGKPFFGDKNVMDRKKARTKRYRCCGEEVGDSPGCVQSEHHVFKIEDPKRLGSIWNFVKTPENVEKISDRPVCFDGEMGYTVYGLELIRLTATSWPSGDEIFDVLVKPLGGILDLNSRWSGVFPQDLAEALPWSKEAPVQVEGQKKKIRMVDSPQAARDLLFSHISPHTPLIGHGLENDLTHCRIIHPTLIDTVLLYPHRMGLPQRNGLKALVKTHLNRDIQMITHGEVTGHDSKEDANAAGDLVRYRLKTEWEKLKREGWILKDGQIKPPTPKELYLPDGDNYFNVRESETDVKVPTGPRKRVGDDNGGETGASAGFDVSIDRPRKKSKHDGDERRSSFSSDTPTEPKDPFRGFGGLRNIRSASPLVVPKVEDEKMDELNY